MNVETLLILLDLIAGAVLLNTAFHAIVHMSRRTRHCIRLIYIVLAAGGLSMLFSFTMDPEFRRLAHVAVISALAALGLFDHRRGEHLLKG